MTTEIILGTYPGQYLSMDEKKNDLPIIQFFFISPTKADIMIAVKKIDKTF